MSSIPYVGKFIDIAPPIIIITICIVVLAVVAAIVASLLYYKFSMKYGPLSYINSKLGSKFKHDNKPSNEINEESNYNDIYQRNIIIDDMGR